MYQFIHAPEIKSLEHEIQILEHHLKILKQSKEIIIPELNLKIIYSRCDQLQTYWKDGINQPPNNPHFLFQVIDNPNFKITKELKELIHDWLQKNVC